MKIKIFLIILILGLISNVKADIYEYKDKNGKSFMVNDLQLVPSEYRAKAQLLIKDNPNVSKNSKLITSNSQNVQPVADKSLNEKIKERAAKEKAHNTANSSKKSIEVYVTDWCGYCRKLEAFLKQNNIAYTRYNVEQDRDAQARFYKMNPRGGVPLMKLGDKIVFGYDQQAVLNYVNK